MSETLNNLHALSSAHKPSLFQELRDGSSGVIVRAGVSLALAPMLAGTAMIGSYILARFIPQWGYRGFRPSDQLVGSLMALGGFAYVAVLGWLWTRSRHRINAFLKAIVLTIGTVII